MKANKSTIILSIILFMLLGVSLYENHKLKLNVIDKNRIINESNTVNNQTERIDTLIREVESKIRILKDGKVISLDELIEYSNSINDKLDEVNDSLDYYKVYFEMSKKNKNDEFKIVQDSTGNQFYHYALESLDEDFVDSVLAAKNNRINNLLDSIADIQTKNNIYKKTLDKYNIEIKIQKVENDQIYYEVDARKIDSALMILPHYRKNLKYDEKKDVWTIDIKRFF